MKKVKHPSRRHLSRALALQALYAWSLSGLSMRIIQCDLLESESSLLDDDERIDPKLCDQKYFVELIEAIPDKIEELEQMLAPFCARAIDEMTPIERVILWLAAFELKEKVEIPFKVVVNEAIELAKSFGVTEGHRYINAVLDKAAAKLREPELL